MEISQRFAERHSEGRSTLIPYMTCGFPSLEASVEVLSAIVESGGDILELGIPFSDPLADGPTIQASTYRALEGGMTVAGTLDVLTDFRKISDVPVVLFSYVNPILQYGLESFLTDAVEAGAQGILLTDVPTGTDPGVEDAILDSSLDLIRLISPTTVPERIPVVAESSQGFLYYISRTGVTGAQDTLRKNLVTEVQSLRSEVDLPVAVGFGISEPNHAALISSVADGIVVGSALIERLDNGGIDEASAFLASIRNAMDLGNEIYAEKD